MGSKKQEMQASCKRFWWSEPNKVVRVVEQSQMICMTHTSLFFSQLRPADPPFWQSETRPVQPCSTSIPFSSKETEKKRRRQDKRRDLFSSQMRM